VGWHPLQVALNGDADLTSLEQQVETLLAGRVGADLLLLELSGQLSIDGQQRLDGLLQRWEAQLLRLKRRGQVGLRADAAELQALADQTDAPLVAAVVRNLQQQLANSHGDRTGTLAQALLELHRSVADACA
jgi:hypothetical protein